MKKTTVLKTLVVAALIFGGANNASAQLGGLMKKAKKAVKEKVDPGSTATGGDVAPNGWAYHGGKVHKFIPIERAEILKFLECNQTPDMETVYSYYDLPSSETINAPAKEDYSDVAGDLIRLLWDLHDVEGKLGGKNAEGWLKTIDKDMAEKINRGASYGTEPAEVADKFDAELMRVKALFHDKHFPNEPKLVGADNSAWFAEREASRAEFKYGLNNLKDVGPNANKYKPQFEALVKKNLAPTKILGVYLVSGFWRGLYLPNFPQYSDYASVQEIPMKAFYIKGGKYYYVTGGFRKGYLKTDPGMTSKPFTDYNPGLETPIEIPADIAKKYFK